LPLLPEDATGGEQSGADSRPAGCQKLSIPGIADGVQVLWWRTPVLVIGRCNSAVAATPDGRLVLVTIWCSYDLSVLSPRTLKELRRVP
jgi:hypothetical protein